MIRAGVSVMGLLMLLLLLSGVVALIIALLRHRGARRAFFVVGGILGVTLVLLLTAAFFTRATRVVSVEYATPSRHMTYNDVRGAYDVIYPSQSPLADSLTVLTPTPSHAPRAVPAPAEATSGADWPLIDEQFLADQYPSQKAAAEALALHLVKQWTQPQPEDPLSPGRGHATDEGGHAILILGNAPPPVLTAAMQALQARYPHVQITKQGATLAEAEDPSRSLAGVPGAAGQPGDDLRKSLTATSQSPSQPAAIPTAPSLQLEFKATNPRTTQRGNNPTQHETGTLQATWHYPDGRLTGAVNWVSTPWVQGWPGGDSPAARHTSGGWVVGYSSSLCTSPAEAHRAARAAAAEELLQEARIAIQQRYMARPDWLTTHLSGSNGDAWLRGMLAAEINSNRPVADEFAQKFDRGYGTVYRQAVLVSDTAQVIRRVSDQFETRVYVQHESWKSIFVSFGGLMLLVLVVYLFLNAATRGYYTWSLRIASVVLVIGGILAVLVIA